MNPGDTFRQAYGRPPGSEPLNEGRGMNPGDTPGGTPRGDAELPALNEGRGMNPGDTRYCDSAMSRNSRAQRRPGDEPRRHS